MNLKDFSQSPKIKWLMVGIGSVIVLLLTFQFGMYVGFHKANYSFGWGENYHHAFGGPRGGFLRDFGGRDFVNGHGTVGEIAKVEEKNIVIADRDGFEKIINITDATKIEQGTAALTIKDLKPDMEVVVVGDPNTDGSINAKLIRVFPRGIK